MPFLKLVIKMIRRWAGTEMGKQWSWQKREQRAGWSGLQRSVVYHRQVCLGASELRAEETKHSSRLLSE